MRPMSSPRFERVAPVADFPAVEARVREFWQEGGIVGRSLEHRRGGPRFVFYEGPPTANGLPHNGHVLTRVMKDVFPRYKAMRDLLRNQTWMVAYAPDVLAPFRKSRPGRRFSGSRSPCARVLAGGWHRR